MFAYSIIVCSKISLVGDSCRKEASHLACRSRIAGFCSMRAATEGYFRTHYSSNILLLLNLLFFINPFELAISADHHRLWLTLIPQLWLFRGVIFFRLQMPVNLSKYRAAVGVFNNRNLSTSKKLFYFTESNSVGINLLFISVINVMVFFFFFFVFVVSAHQKNRKIRFKLILLPVLRIGFAYITFGYIST